MTNQEMWTDHVYYNTKLHPSLAKLFKSKLQDFYSENGHRIKTLNETLKNLEKSYFEHDENGIAKLTHAEEGKPSTPILLEGKTMEDFNNSVNNIMNQQVGSALIKI